MGAWLAMEALRQIAISGRPLARALGGLALFSGHRHRGLSQTGRPDRHAARAHARHAVEDGPGPPPVGQTVGTAATARQLRRHCLAVRSGISTIDLSRIDDGDRGGHFNAASSPTAIARANGVRRGIGLADGRG